MRANVNVLELLKEKALARTVDIIPEHISSNFHRVTLQ
jgi:hypothetical protein